MSSSNADHYAKVFDEILAIDLSTCAITVCLASVVKDETPRFARLEITEKLATGFRDTLKSFVENYKRDDYRQLSMFPEYVEGSSLDAYEIETLPLSSYQSILDQISPLKAL